MVNLTQTQTERLQREVFAHYITTRENTYKPNMRLHKAIQIVDEIMGKKNKMTVFEKAEIIEYIEDNLIQEGKLKCIDNYLFKSLSSEVF